MKLQELIKKLQGLEAKYGNAEVHFNEYESFEMKNLQLCAIFGDVLPAADGHTGEACPCEVNFYFQR